MKKFVFTYKTGIIEKEQTINAENRKSAFKKFRWKFPKGEHKILKCVQNDELSDLRSYFDGLYQGRKK